LDLLIVIIFKKLIAQFGCLLFIALSASSAAILGRDSKRVTAWHRADSRHCRGAHGTYKIFDADGRFGRPLGRPAAAALTRAAAGVALIFEDSLGVYTKQPMNGPEQCDAEPSLVRRSLYFTFLPAFTLVFAPDPAPNLAFFRASFSPATSCLMLNHLLLASPMSFHMASIS
jgi:hypothetical protein